MENPSIKALRDGNPRNREVRLPPLPPGLEVYRPAEVLGSAVLVVEAEAAMQLAPPLMIEAQAQTIEAPDVVPGA